MPSPLGHTLLGLGIYVLFCRNIHQWLKEWKIVLWIVFCANLPDIDFIPGLIEGNLGLYHQTYTHTLGFVLLITLITFTILKLKKNKETYYITLLTFITLIAHLILDMLTLDTKMPIGVQFLWPFSKQYFNIYPVFSPVPHSNLSDISSPLFIKAIIYEAVLLFIPITLLILFKRRQKNK